MSSLCNAVLVCHEQSFVRKSFVICFAVSRGMEIKDLKLEADEIMISFDVVSLLTSKATRHSETNHKRFTYKRLLMANQNSTTQRRHT